jgi:predicted RNase H-like HicB family nuclease
VAALGALTTSLLLLDYAIRIHQAEEGGFWSEVPTLPGCYSQGETIDETLRNSKEAIEVHLLVLKGTLVAAPVD